jgi:hypothetical protein
MVSPAWGANETVRGVGVNRAPFTVTVVGVEASSTATEISLGAVVG